MELTQNTKKRQSSDFYTLAKMLGITYAAAKMRFYRCNEEAMEKMLQIVEAKEKLISNSSKEVNNNQGN